MAALRKPKRPILGALEEGDELEPAEPPTTAGTPPMEKKRLQLTIKNVLLRAQVTRLFTDKPVNSIVPEIPSSIPLHTPNQETSSEGGSTNDDDHGAAVEARKKEASQPDYGRNLVLAESCRAAFCRDAENRSTSDLQALRTWFQKTKLKTCTDFESLQAMEVLLPNRPNGHAIPISAV
ncbi:hypothetical protein DYB26_007023, partial [Aphanomyces astaci]